MGSGRFLHWQAMEQLGGVLPYLEEADLSGQVEMGAEGWTALGNALKMGMAPNNDKTMTLKKLVLAQCKVREMSKNMLEDNANKCGVRIDFGKSEVDGNGKNKLKKVLCCSSG